MSFSCNMLKKERVSMPGKLTLAMTSLNWPSWLQIMDAATDASSDVVTE